MTMLRLRTTKQSIDEDPQAQQVLRSGEQFALAPPVRGYFVRPGVRPLDRNETSAAIGKQQEKLNSVPAVDLAYNLKSSALENMCLARDLD